MTTIFGNKNIPIHCFLDNEIGLGTCGDGIWKLVMKMDGHKVLGGSTYSI